MAGKHLFICGTPLHCLIIKRIIELEGLEKQDCSLFFYSYVQTKKYRYYYEDLARLCDKSRFYYCDNRYPGYVLESKKILTQFDFDNVYFAAVNSTFVLMSLSLGRHKRIFTFDDGTANIMPRSPYAAKYGLSAKKFLGLGVLGNRYNIERIRNETSAHYTIYPGFKNNISDNLVPVTIFPDSERSEKVGRCSLILGTVFHEAFPEELVEESLSNLSIFCQSLRGDVYYLPHPRSTQMSVVGCTAIDSDWIAEEVVGDLFQRYGTVDLYGFSSSAQLNVAHFPGLKNHLFSSSVLKSSALEMSKVAAEGGVSFGDIIDLDKSNS